MRPRFSIAGLAAFVALSGIAFASIRSPSQLWASTLFAMALGALPYGLLRAIYSRERSRAFWVGFTTVGSLYFVSTLGPWFRDEWGPRMVTTAALDMLYTQVAPSGQPQTVSFSPTTFTGWNVNNPNAGSTIVTTALGPPPAPPILPTVGLAGEVVNVVVDPNTTTVAQPGTSAAPVAVPNGWISYNNTGWLVTGTTPPLSFKARWAAWTEVDRNDGVGWQIGQFSLQSTAPFRRIGHSLLTLVFAAAGGAVAARRYSKMMASTPRREPAAEPA